jgi:arylsulfatase A-like enzyme
LSRRGFVRAAGGALLAVSPLSRLLGAAPSENINVLLLVCDALRPDRLGCNGYKRNLPGGGRGSTTRFIDGLAERGVVFENCIAQASWTQTSMARHRYLPADDYASAKLLNDEFDWEAADLARAGKPFFAYIHYMEPHGPYTHEHQFRGALAPPDWQYARPFVICRRLSRYHDDTGKVTAQMPAGEQAAVLGMSDACDEDVMYMDVQIGRLLGMLRRYGVLDRTYVILTADHGQSFGEHGWCGHKMSLYGEEINVPLIITGPGLGAGGRVKAQVRAVDILPTIAALSGVSVEGLAGAPLLPAARVASAGNREAYSCCDYARYGDERRLLTCLVTPERMKYIRIMTRQRELLREELFDLNSDPSENNDLAAERGGVVKETSARMDALEKKNYWGRSERPETEMDEQTRRQLESLGYLGE